MKHQPPPPPPKVPYTAAAFAKLQADFVRLTNEKKLVMERLIAAREMGDLSENGAYIYAKFELGSISRQLQKITELLKTAEVVEKKAHYNVVEYGCSVTVMSNKKETTYTIVSDYEVSPLEHKISIKSPLGKALAGKKVGESTVMVTPKGETEIVVIKIT